AGFGLFEDRHDLAVGKSGLLHCSNFLVVEILLQLTAVLWGDYLSSSAGAISSPAPPNTT
ncbi:hypothetical protein, partial [Pollutimonas subterranea]|uniref:hypothetical protein n=1 Tax=Pollutimonas subterranea TaxID=2045210 RepID=UPI001E651E2D